MVGERLRGLEEEDLNSDRSSGVRVEDCSDGWWWAWQLDRLYLHSPTIWSVMIREDQLHHPPSPTPQVDVWTWCFVITIRSFPSYMRRVQWGREDWQPPKWSRPRDTCEIATTQPTHWGPFSSLSRPPPPPPFYSTYYIYYYHSWLWEICLNFSRRRGDSNIMQFQSRL